MKIEVYVSEDAPAARKAVAYIVHDGQVWPIRFFAVGVGEACAAAQTHWDEKVTQDAKRSAKKGAPNEGLRRYQEQRKAAKAGPQDDFDVI